nr:phosphate ABC transporter permease subunit PstC [Halorhabdus rudnickae]
MRDYRARTADGAIAMHAVGIVSTVLSFALFFGGSDLTIVPFLVFLGTVAFGWRRYQAELAKGLTLLTTVATVAILVLIIGFLLIDAFPAFRHMGLDLLLRTEDPFWQAPTPDGIYALTPMMVGTALTTLIAMAIAAPFGIAGAVFISEIAPPRIREIVKPGIELMAGIPSITYGFVGLTIVNAYFYDQFRTPTIGDYFTAGLMIGLMALPTVVTIAEDALNAVPDSMKDGSMAMGSTKWQTTKSVTVPAALSGVSSGVLLGIGRAMGETMAATVMLSHTKGIPGPPFDVFSRWGETLTTVIASEGAHARGMHLSVLFAGGVILFGMVMALSVASQYVEWRMQRKLGGRQ